MPEWLKLPRSARPQPDTQSDFIFHMLMSPYELPVAVRGTKLTDNRVGVEFQYIDGDEPVGSMVRINDHVYAIHGKHSNRLLQLIVHVDKLSMQESKTPCAYELAKSDLRNELNTAMTQLADSTSELTRRAAIKSTKAAVEAREPELFRQVYCTQP